jgi:NTE family protein
VALSLLGGASRTDAAAQAVNGSDRPVVGLVLSGGGARGFAHLGVLKVLHEMNIPVDVIAGTSMGAVVGGVYATGLSYPDLEALVLSEDWSRLFEDDPARRQLPMRRKRLDRQQPMGLELGLGLDGFRFPSGLVGDSKLTNALQAYTYRASRLETFDDLPIPFRAVAANIDDGSMVVLDRGNLGDAMRASMAVPGAFSPQMIDGARLVDGGLVMNLPIGIARSMGADVVIVSDVSTTLEEAPDPESAIAIARRLVVLITTASNEAELTSLTDDDVYIRGDLSGIGSADFTALDTAMAVGQTAAQGVQAQLATLAVSAADFAAITNRRASALAAAATLQPVAVEVDTTNTRLAPRVIEATLGIEPGDTLSPMGLRDDLTRVVGYGGFESAEFRVRGTPEGDVLEVHPKDKSWGPTFLRPALSLTDQQRGTGGWSLRGYIEWTRIAARGGAAWAEVELGTRHGVRLWSQLPIDAAERFFVVGHGSLGRREVAPEVAGLPISLDLTDRQAFAGVGARLGWWGDLVVGGAVAHNKLAAPPDVPDLQDEVWDERSVDIRLDIDVLDRVAFPSSGGRLQVDYSRADSTLGGTVAFEQLRIEALGVASTGPLSATFGILASTGLGTEVPFYRSEPLGGIERLAGISRDAVSGPYAALGKATVSYRIGADASDAGGGLRIGASAEAGQAQRESTGWSWPPDDLIWGGSLWIGASTPVGPLKVAVAAVEGRSPGWVVQVGAPR